MENIIRKIRVCFRVSFQNLALVSLFQMVFGEFENFCLTMFNFFFINLLPIFTITKSFLWQLQLQTKNFPEPNLTLISEQLVTLITAKLHLQRLLCLAKPNKDLLKLRDLMRLMQLQKREKEVLRSTQLT